MAWLLARAQVQQGCSKAQLARELGLPPGQLPRLALCFKPAPGPLHPRRRRPCGPGGLLTHGPGRCRAAALGGRALHQPIPPGTQHSAPRSVVAGFRAYDFAPLRVPVSTDSKLCVPTPRIKARRRCPPRCGSETVCLTFKSLDAAVLPRLRAPERSARQGRRWFWPGRPTGSAFC
jgi:hypothetical protein